MTSVATRLGRGAALAAILSGSFACSRSGRPAASAAAAVPARASSPVEAPPLSASNPDTLQPATSGSAAPESRAPSCDVVCEGARVVPRKVPPDETADAYTTEAVDKANNTLNGMNDDLLRCYTARLKVYPKAHAFLTIDILVGPDGRVERVETQGGALLGDNTMKCIVDRIKQGDFAPPHGGGTMRFEVPFTLRRLGPDDVI